MTFILGIGEGTGVDGLGGADNGSTNPIFMTGEMNASAGLDGVLLGGSSGTPNQIFMTGDMNASARLEGVLLGGSPVGLNSWMFSDDTSLYVFENNPSAADTPGRNKQIIYNHRSAPGNKNVIYSRKGGVQEVQISGSILTQTQLEAMEEWAKKRHAITLTDDLDREYSIYISSFEPRRVNKQSHPYYHTYTLRYIIAD